MINYKENRLYYLIALIFFKENLATRRHYRFILIFKYVLPLIWSLFRNLLKFISGFSEKFEPGANFSGSFIMLTGSVKDSDKRLLIGPDLSAGTFSWLNRKYKSSEVLICEDIRGAKVEKDNTILVITYDWMISGPLHSGFKIDLFRIIRFCRKNKIKIWVMTSDTFDHRHLIPASLLVAFCGGSTILSANTKSEATNFGLIHPSNPQFWILSEKNLQKFSSPILLQDREKSIVLAYSGEIRRIQIMDMISHTLQDTDWKAILTTHSLDWPEYIKIVKSARVIVTTCWLQNFHINGTKRNKDRLPKFTLTGRVWEGFAAGAVVVTNRNSVLDEFGFIPGEHYLDLPLSNDAVSEIFELSEKEMETIAIGGAVQFQNLVANL